MARTLGKIALIAGTAALVAAGVGAVGGLLLFGTTAGVGIAGIGSIGAILTASSILTAVGNGLNALAGPKAPPSQTTAGTKRDPISARVYAYGRRRFYGVQVLFETNDAGATVDAFAFLEGKSDGVEQVYLNDQKVTLSGGFVQPLPDNSYQANHVLAGFNLGNATETAFAAVISRLPGVWTSNHRGDGVTTGYLIKLPEKDRSFLTTYPQGDNVQLSAVFRGQLCYDPRDGATRWTENPVLHLLHYLTVRRGFDYAKRIQPTLDYWIAAANVCDEAVPLREGGTEKRYRSCVTYEATATPKEVLSAILETFDGWIATRGDGSLIIYAGKVYTPRVTIGPNEIISYRVQNFVEDENFVDQLTVSYVSEAHDWNTVETTAWGDDSPRRTDAISPQSPSYSQNRRIAKRFLSKQNAPKRGSCTTNLSGRKIRGERYIYLDLHEEGYDPFDGIPAIVEVNSLQRDMSQGGVTFEWTLTDRAVDSWNPATEQGYPAPVGDTVPSLPLDPPIQISAMAQYSNVGQTPGSGGLDPTDPQDVQGARILITASGPPNRNDLTWYARWRSSASAPWNESEYSDADPGPGVSLLTEYVPYGGNIETEVAYKQGDGRISDWSNSKTTSTSP